MASVVLANADDYYLIAEIVDLLALHTYSIHVSIVLDLKCQLSLTKFPFVYTHDNDTFV